MTIRDLTTLGTSSQQHTRTRNHGAYFLRWNGEGFLFDPGEGTQRQFIFADIAPTAVTRILISHFHGDHCLGLGSMLMRLNLDKVTHPIHCYYPKSGKAYFDRLRYGTIYRERIEVIEHPIEKAGVVHDDGSFCISSYPLDHGVDAFSYRIEESPTRRFDKELLQKQGIKGAAMRKLIEQGSIEWQGKNISIDDVSFMEKGDIFSYALDTRLCPGAYKAAKDATMLLCESTYLDSEKQLAEKYKHMTATQAAQLAKESDAKHLILTHFSARYSNLKLFEKEAREVFPQTQVAEDLKKFSFPRHRKPYAANSS